MYKWNIKESRFSIPAIDKDLDESNFVEVSEEQYESLRAKVAEGGFELCVVDGVLSYKENTKSYTEEFYTQQESNLESRTFLESTDWKVIKELERMYLKDTELGKAREAARSNIVKQEIPIVGS
jgi:hypothetical protein